MKRLYAAFCTLLAVAGCQGSAVEPPPPLSFSKYQPFNMAVSSIEVVEEYQSPLKSPNVEHLFRTTPAEAVRLWVSGRMRAVGSENTLQVVIKDASVTETPLSTTGGLQGLFINEQARRYDARLSVEIRVYGTQSALSVASVEANASRSDTVPENASVLDRDRVSERLVYDLMQYMNATLEKNIYANLGNYISYSSHP